jgi:hypothetical protein
VNIKKDMANARCICRCVICDSENMDKDNHNTQLLRAGQNPKPLHAPC